MGDAPSIDPPAPVADMAAAMPHADISLLHKLHTRVVREARRETWFVVNQSDDDLATIPIQLVQERSIRRVQVNGEVAEFSASPEIVLVRPRLPLRPGAGTIVVIHFR